MKRNKAESTLYGSGEARDLSGEKENESKRNTDPERSLRYVQYALAFALVVVPLVLGLLVFVFAFPNFQFPSRSISWVIIAISFIVSMGYIYYGRIDFKASKRPEAKPSERNCSLKLKDFELFKLQYEQLSEGIRSRDSYTMIGGTILIAASILLLGSSVVRSMLIFSYNKP